MQTRLIISVVLLVASISSCSRQEQYAHRTNPELMPQTGSLSLTGPNQVSVVLSKSRELRITHDAGRTWQVIPATAVADAFECATMIDDRRGWALNHQGHVFITDSGGATWTRISQLHEFTCAGQIEFINEKEGWIRECLSLWRTLDGGVSWNKTLSTITPGVLGQPTGMFLFDVNTVVVSGSGGQVYSTKDGGQTWKIESPLAAENIDFNDVWFVDRQRGWVAGYQILVAGESQRPLLFETINGGESWKQVSVNADIRPSSVCFVGDDGWLAGSRRIVNGDSVKLEGVLLHTTDGGIHWQTVELGPNEPFLTDVRFADKDHGWLVGRDTIYRTDDSGKTWRPVLSLPPPVATLATWEPIFFKMINQRLSESGIPELRTAQMTGDDLEVRVWVGFGGTGEDGIILRRSSNQWSALHLHGISKGPRLVSTVNHLAAPRSGWEAAWQKLTQAGLLTLPDALAIDCSTRIFDGVSYVVEINKDQKYRTYLYDNPSHAKCSEAKQMLEIGGIIAEEFGLSEFKTG